MTERTEDRRKRPLSAGEFASRLGVSPKTVRKWLRDGEVRGKRVGDKGHWLVPESEAERLEGGGER